MFCTHKIELNALPHDLPTPLIPREILTEYAQSRQLLEHAQAQAQELMRQAETQCETVLKNASDQFWGRANAQLQRWESERQAMFDHLEEAATLVINKAVRGLLEETLPAQRVTALLKKLLVTQLPAVEASLLCNPQDRELVEHWLLANCDALWTLRVESRLTAGSLILETEDGDFHINWDDAVNNLVAMPPKASSSNNAFL
ncbi:type III secretion system stator protein SctL [Pseudomonas costantinii]|uniref:Type III secretion protein n=1 Tax=Pseudomonas costantinii TaxID=168469 RepID=A0A1S2USD7_9PSED|nr:type III secretion system stator protein SctL [Pseudomonas costantinii]NVZ19370.1 type III secretion system stator protein SctL [Pseudomonas costantinii]OIN49352.1 type III secretion protein [Pseudomonas costantinii]SEE15759.1 type III secretion protein L [Pseudomonas costantinii]